MTSRWARLESLYHQAAALSAGARARFLDESCHDDADLRAQLEVMLRHADSGFLEEPPLMFSDAPDHAASSPGLIAGTRLGVYEVGVLLGVGGMGEVYRARDTRLGRDVALKVLPASFTNDAERAARFRREAQILASLNHPHIAQIYGLEEDSGTQCLVLELVDGESLDKRIARGPIPIPEALGIAKQIAEAVEAAHRKGIIHRDLKPANVQLDNDGTIKILDFGLAKPSDAIASGHRADSPTITSPAMMTAPGTLLGTAAYMSPEQARGMPADKQSDVWAFGCVLYEMLTGKRAFDGDTVTEIIATVIRDEPDWTALPPGLRTEFRLLFKRCLEKNRATRIGDLSVATFLLTEAAALSSSEGPARRRTTVGVGIGLLVVVALGGAIALKIPERSSVAPRVTRFTITPAEDQALALDPDFDKEVAISPDGSYVVYRGGDVPQLLVRSMDDVGAHPVEGTAGALVPFVSPDAVSIGFVVRVGADTFEVRTIPASGGRVVTVCRIRSSLVGGGTWLTPDTIAFHAPGGIWTVPSAGGVPQLLLPDVADTRAVFPSPLPEGRGVLYAIVSGTSESAASRLAVLDSRTGRTKVLSIEGFQPHYVGAGHLVYSASGSIRSVRFDLESLSVNGEAVPVVDRVLTLTSVKVAHFAVSGNGTLVYIPGDVQKNEFTSPRSLVSVDRRGREELVGAPQRAYGLLRLSPDGSRVAIDIRDQENDIWIWDFRSRALSRLTFDPAADRAPLWTPDGRRIIFSSIRSGAQNLYWQPADGTGVPERLTTSSAGQQPASISPDGASVAYSEREQDRAVHIGVLALDRRAAAQVLRSSVELRNPELSPDGHWLAYESNESGRVEVYVRPFPNVEGGRWQVSTGGGAKPAWSRNGHELFYLAGNAMMVVAVQTVATFEAGSPAKLFDALDYSSVLEGRTYDLSADGKRFLMSKLAAPTFSPPSSASLHLIVTEHWFDDRKARGPR
jgi:serine/threonine protein kinase/Tol biopolymer transport system component